MITTKDIKARINSKADLAKRFVSEGKLLEAENTMRQLVNEIYMARTYSPSIILPKTESKPIAGWFINDEFFERDDGKYRVNRFVDARRDGDRPFAIYTKGYKDVFPVWAPHRWATAESAMRAADKRVNRTK